MAASPAAPLPPFFFASSNQDDDDEEEFGEFAFAPPLSFQPIATAVVDNDEWGDFVERPIARSHPLQETLWQRSRGAIPLSIFGEEEEDDHLAEFRDPFFSPGGDGRVDPGGEGSTFSHRQTGGSDSALNALFVSTRDGGGTESSEENSIFSSATGRGLEVLAITEVLDDLYGKVADKMDGSVVGCGNGVAVEEVENDDFDDGGWEFKCAVVDGGFSDPVAFGPVQDSTKVKDPQEGILHFKVGNSDQQLNYDGVQHGAFDLFSGITLSAGHSENRGSSNESSFIPIIVNGNTNFDTQSSEAKHARGVDLFQWQEEFVKENENSHSSTKVNLYASGRKFQDLWESQKEGVTMMPSDIKKQDSKCFIDAPKDLFSFQETSAKSESIDRSYGHIPSSNDLLLDLYEEHGRVSSFDFKILEDNDKDSAKEIICNGMECEKIFQESHISTANVFLERDGDCTTDAEPIAENVIDLYSKVKDVSFSLAHNHLHDLKKLFELAKLSNEESTANELQLQIQDAYTKLQHEDDVRNMTEGKCCYSEVSCNQLLECLKHPKLLGLDLEYSLSEKIKLAENDLTSAVRLFEHAVVMMHTLQLGTLQVQHDYIAAWTKMLAICEQELQHGALILAHSLHVGVRKKLLSNPKGCYYFLALCEIYRVVEILNTTLTVYKPWIISNAVEPEHLFVIVDRCRKFWADTGLGESLEDISAEEESRIKERIDKILKSAHRIHNLSTADIQSLVSSLREPTCHLSLLSPSMLPEMEVVAWNGEKYFSKLANLWANLVSSDPSKLPSLLR